MKTKLLLLLSLISLQMHAQCWSKIASGLYHTVAVAQDGTLWTWGSSTYANVNSSVPIQIGTANDWVSVGSGYHHSFAIKANGTLWAWGYNYYGQLGNGAFGNTANISVPTQIGTDTNWRSVTGSESHTLAIKTDGTLWSTGKNGYGELGLNDYVDRHVFTQVNADVDWKEVACGRGHSIALKIDGKFYSWGGNGAGQMGVSHTSNTLKIPYNMMQQYRFIAIAGGLGSTIAIRTDGTIWRAGYGCPIPGSGYTFTQFVAPPENWNSVKIGNNFVIATKNDGTIWSLGTSDYGQLGQVADSPSVFVNPSNTNDWSTNISVNNFGVLALKNNGQLYGTGQNVDGELGLGDLVNRSAFTAMTCPFTLGRNDFSQNNLEVTIYPNPVNDILNFVPKNGLEIQKVVVFDATGKQIKEQTGNATSLFVGHLISGFYMVEITIDGKKEIKKFVKK